MRDLREIIRDNAGDLQERASQEYPAVDLPTGHRLHVCEIDTGWEVWLNTELADFDGLCIGSGRSYNEAVADAVSDLEAALVLLNGPIQKPLEFP